MSPVKLYKPTTPARRHASTVATPQLAKEPHKRLIKSLVRKAGRGAGGRISVRHKSAGAKKAYRQIDLAQQKTVPAVVEQLEYDPYRTAFIALLKYADGDRRYVLAVESLKSGQAVITGPDAPASKGNRLPLGKIPTGSDICNVQTSAGAAGTLVRSAGASASLVAHEGRYTQIKLPSGEVRRLLSDCLATIGVISNGDHLNVRIGKAGRNRHKGIRPHVRGKAMNPVDHPHGGGEGGSPIGLAGPKTPSGLFTLGRKTRRKRKRTTGVVRARS